MKYIYRIIMITLLSSLSILSCCKKDSKDETIQKPVPEEKLPPLTTSGQNTFGCRVDGKVWVARSNTSFPKVYAYFDRAHNRTLGVTANIIEHPDKFHTIGMRVYYQNSVSEYPLHLIKDTFSNANYVDLDKNLFWNTDSLIGGRIRLIKYDTIRQIISGTFYFDCINKETGRIKRITDGRFDMNFFY